MRAEDADVDELLRMIATAEEALEERHTTDATVLITDMKSFSRMTQEQGTLATAKLDPEAPRPAAADHHERRRPREVDRRRRPARRVRVARRRARRGRRDAAGAQAATTTKQARREAGPGPRRASPSGDVILDRGGCPFIGDALNLAARVMSLADGGQVFAARDVVDAAAELPSPVVSHGEFALKNIARPVNVDEVLWDEGQQPRRPESSRPPRRRRLRRRKRRRPRPGSGRGRRVGHGAGDRESNPQPAVYKTAALPLSYAGDEGYRTRSRPATGQARLSTPGGGASGTRPCA